MFEQILSAQKRLAGFANRTPVMTSNTLNEMLGVEVYFKCENFQKTGAFKFRGALNSISQLSSEAKKRGVLTYSSGNHAQAVALVGRMLGINTHIIMPENAPQIKLDATRAYGASIIQYNPATEVREDIAEKLNLEFGYSLIPPYNHLDVIAGQGTAALEFFEELKGIETLLVPCGGGGLLSGSAIAAKAKSPNCRVIGIEPQLADDATRSFYTRTLQTVHNPQTIADGTRTPSLGALTFPLVLDYVDEMITVSEADIFKAVQFLFYRMKLVVEPSGALGLAALLSQAASEVGNGPMGIIISGGNIDARTLTQILNNDLG
ncbi:MAG: threonine dehydratase [Candidatus Azotimanducaceae bacterium]|jgi:threonine dehydratase